MNATTFDAVTATDTRAGWRHVLACWRREARAEFLKVWRTPAFALPTLAFPATFYAVFALLLPGNFGPYDKATYLLATYGVFGVMGPALFGFGVGVAQERENGWLDLKRIAPMPPGTYFAGKIAMSMLFAVLVVLLLSLLAFAGGVRLAPERWLALVGLLALAPLPFCTMGVLIGSAVRAPAAVAIVNLVYLPMSLLSGLWLPLSVFPPWLQAIGSWLPPRPLAEMALSLVGVGAADWLRGSLLLLGWSALFLLLAGWLQRRGGAAQD